MQSEPSAYKFDIYRATYNDWGKTMPYIHPQFEHKLLESRQLHKDRYWVPNDYHYYMVLIYHIVYHKGTSSGIRSKVTDGRIDMEERYVKELLHVCKQNEDMIKFNDANKYSLEYFHNVLVDEGLSPDIESLRMFYRKNRCNFLKSLYNFTHFEHGILTVFMFREICYDMDFVKD